MAGRPRGSEPRTELLRVRLTPTARLMVETARGGLSVSDYIRQLVVEDCKRKGLV